MRAGGYTLIEALVATTLLLGVFGGTFYFFSVGARGFTSGVSRSETLNDFQTFARSVKRDLELTHYSSVSIFRRSTETRRGLADRHAVSLAGLSDWKDDSNFEAGTGFPNWDRWILHYANREDLGRLYRAEFRRPPVSSGSYYPLTPRRDSDLKDLLIGDPSLLPESLSSRTLSRNVHSFHVDQDLGTQSVTVELTTYVDPGLRMTSQARDDEYKETRIVVVPLNTFPPI